VFGSLDDIASHWQLDREFHPDAEAAAADQRYAGWKRAVERSRNWAT
jgi:glycerol kinase